MTLRRFLRLGVIIAPLPNNILDGQIADAAPVMANFQWILSQVNTNVPPLVGGSVSGKNYLYNGSMQIAQRIGVGGSSAVVNTSLYLFDRWEAKAGAGGDGVITQVSALLTGFQYAQRVQRFLTNANTLPIKIAQSLETGDSYPLAGQPVTLSFFARAGANYSPAGSVVNAAVITGTGTDENVLTGYTGAATALTTSPTLTSAWQRFQVTGALASTATEVGVVFTMTPVGTAGAADYFDVTGVQLEVASAASTFQVESFPSLLAKCQRYFQKSFAYATQPAPSVTAGQLVYPALLAGATAYGVTVSFAEHMRVAPSLVTYNPGGGSGGKWRNGTQAADSGTASATVCEWGFNMENPQISSDAVGDLIAIQWAADAEL